jgi:hypothetical protein
MKPYSQKCLGAIATFPIVLLLGSCSNNFKSIEEFGQTSAIVKVSSAKMSNDIYQSCLRQTRYVSGKLFPNNIDTSDREKQEKDCDIYQSSAEKVTKVNSVLINYMVALGKLASNDTVSFEKNLDALENSLKSLGNSASLKEDQVNAGLKIARFIFNRLTTQFRHRNLNEAILCTNQSVQTYIPGLVSIVQDYYLNGRLRSEGLNIDRYYRKYAPAFEQKSPLSTLFPIEQSYIKDIDALNDRKQAAYAYIEILNQTAETHQQLADELQKSAKTAKKIEESCQKYFLKHGDNLVDQTRAPSPKQLNRMNEIVIKYQDEIRPLVVQLNKTF